MNLLRFTQDALDGERYRIEIALEGDAPRRGAKAEVAFRLTEQDEADLRWYLEDYLQWPHDPAPAIAAREDTPADRGHRAAPLIALGVSPG